MSQQDGALGHFHGGQQDPNTACPQELRNQNVHPGHSSSFSSPRASNSPLACPFYKFNPVLYDECKKFQFARVWNMKQHLVRSHSVSEPSTLSCNVCHSPFVDEQSKRLHLHDGSCRIAAAPEKLSPQEVVKLKETRFPRGSSAASQWFAIWIQLFPGHTKPQTPYKESNNIKEVISLISPIVESHFHAAFPSLPRQHRQSDISPVKIIMDNVCRDFCNSLPTSRQRPSIKLPSLDNAGHSPDGRVASFALVLPSSGNPNHDATAVLGPPSFGNNLTSMGPIMDSAFGFDLPGFSEPNNTGIDEGLFNPFSPYIHDHTFGNADVDESGLDEYVGDN
ncbi:unnamed protein product [Clonostachys rhizophaga]|uniref:C2H2-type domain-containing protein n=1 Tax=Clonostachys rhizophaga TaxID=160324 RepID=A0A9N9YL18_9HYPO|nr:unnamed protein product [Clonostachys rhizophaga]